MEAVCMTQSRRDSQTDKQGEMGVLFDLKKPSRSWFKRSANFPTEGRRTLVVWPQLLTGQKKDWPATSKDFQTSEISLEDSRAHW